MDRGTTEGALLIELDGRLIEYRFARRRRRTLSITIDAAGLRVSAPLRAPWREIEAFVRDKERWILKKLDAWARVPHPPVVHGVSAGLLDGKRNGGPKRSRPPGPAAPPRRSCMA